ncbi:hypothetical protein BDW02DRAFT_648599 [Decorospora gaudefroyi]|uniref:Uncharacterized protein n=1 Tax=Decorospora gaudefroyi TaxID=184978 RepID=A0A6A5KI84_9PLEO|nr:hypothetical protein BDW02DRAFT_648599 [Decorospora gaudefroyi]
MSIAFMSANPFSDKYAFKTPTKSVMFCDLTYDPRGDCVATTAQISDQYIQPAAPFDTPTKSAMVADLTTDDPRAGRTSLADEDSSKIATERDEIEVPILQWSPSVSHRSNSSVSSLGVTSTAPTSPMSEESGGPIVWHKGTLSKLHCSPPY